MSSTGTSTAPWFEAFSQRLQASRERILRDCEQRGLDTRRISSFLDRLISGQEGEVRLPPGVTIDTLLKASRLVRQVLFSVLEEEGPLPGQVRDALLDALEDETRRGVAVLSEERDAQLQQARAAHEDAEARWHRLLDVFRQSPAFVTVYRGPDHVIEFTSALSVELFGRDTRGKPAREAMPELERQGILRILDNVYATGEPFYAWELRALVDPHGDGRMEEHFFNTRTHATRDASGKINGVISHTVEITEQVYARKRLEEEVRKLESEREQREQFVSMLSHDLRNPLSAAKMGAQMIVRAPADAERVAALAARVLEGVGRADQMIQDLLDANRLQSGQMQPLELVEGDLRVLVSRVVDDLSHQFAGRFVLEAEAPVPGYWNAPALRRVIENLATNALKYGDPQRPVTLTLASYEDRATLSVQNFGDPLSEEELGALFLPYHRTMTAQRSGKKGWGIGLAVVRGLVEAHGGHVQATSSAGIGTTFTLNLPRDARQPPRTEPKVGE